jgi:hypothetical protein
MELRQHYIKFSLFGTISHTQFVNHFYFHTLHRCILYIPYERDNKTF